MGNNVSDHEIFREKYRDRISDDGLSMLQEYVSNWVGSDDAQLMVQHPAMREDFFEHLGITVGELRRLIAELHDLRNAD